MATNLSQISSETAKPLLPVFRDVASLNQWMLARIRPYIQGRVFEIGSGSGVFSSLYVENNIAIHLNDTEENHRETLRNRFDANSLVRLIHAVDFHHPQFEQVYAKMFGVFSTVLALNISEYAAIDPLAISNAKLLLQTGGCLCLVAKAYTVLFDDSIQDLQTLKESNWPAVKKLFGSDFAVMKTRYFKLLADTDTPAFNQAGLSVLVVSAKK